jgi:hypothetical protein
LFFENNEGLAFFSKMGYKEHTWSAVLISKLFVIAYLVTDKNNFKKFVSIIINHRIKD